MKVAQLEASFSTLSEDMKAVYQKVKAAFENSKTLVDKTLTDGEELPCCGGIMVIHTPGHTPGHICLYLQRNKILIVGDALEVNNGMLVTASPSLIYDPDMYKQSLKKLTRCDIETVSCYHGGVYQDQPARRIAALTKNDAR